MCCSRVYYSHQMVLVATYSLIHDSPLLVQFYSRKRELLGVNLAVIIPANCSNSLGCTPIQWKVASQQMQAYSVMEVFILVLPGYAKLMVPFKCHHYTANTYSTLTQ